MDRALARLVFPFLLSTALISVAAHGASLDRSDALTPGEPVDARLAGVTAADVDRTGIPVPANAPPGDGPVAILFPFEFSAPDGEPGGVAASVGFDGFASATAVLDETVSAWGISRLDEDALPRGVRARGPDRLGGRVTVDGREHEAHAAMLALHRFDGENGVMPFDALRVGEHFDVTIDFPADAPRGGYTLWFVVDTGALAQATDGTGSGRFVASFLQMPGRADRALAHVAAGLEVPEAWAYLLDEPARFDAFRRLPDAVARVTLADGARLIADRATATSAATRAIGATESVNPDAFGTPPGQSRRALAAADDVHAEETVQTNEQGWARLVFADDSRLNIGGNTELVLDRFVYDPDAGTGEVALNAARGVFRFITGGVSADGVTLETPVALIGVRGTDFLVRIAEDVPTRLWVLEGRVDVTTKIDNNTRLVEPYQSVSVQPDGVIVDEPFEPPADDGLAMDPGYWTGGAPSPGGWQNALDGQWTSTSGRVYDARGGAFVRSDFVNLRLACATETPTRAITPVYRCSGTWFESENVAGGQYRGRLYWDGPNRRWYIGGEYNRNSDPGTWHAHNYAQTEGAGGNPPSLRVAMAAGDPASGPPPAEGINRLQPTAGDSLPWARVLNGKWTSTSGRVYDLYNGDFWRSHHLNQRLACGPDATVESITPIYRCAGDWYESTGEVGGRYRARLYWDGPNQRWYLNGEYENLDNPGTWHGHNYAQTEGANGATPAVRVAMAPGGDASAPEAAGVAGLQPVANDTLPWARVLNGKWTSTSGRVYDLYHGDFWRSHHLNQRLACDTAAGVDAITPIYDCRGKWYETNGQLGGYYRARLYWDGPNQRWYLNGEYSNIESPDDWHGHNYAQTEGADGATPAVRVAMAPGGDAGAPEAAGVAALQPAASDSLPWARVLNGRWTSTSGRVYDLYHGDFWRSHHLNQRLACETAAGVDAITPIYTCEGKWYQTNGQLGGYYRARLYWDGPNQRWYLNGEYSNFESPDDWHGHNYAQTEGTNGAPPSIGVAMAAGGGNASAPEAAGIAALQPAGGNAAWARALSGKFTSTSGRVYDVYRGDFWRSRHLNMRLACTGAPASEDGSPAHDCEGKWYETTGEVGGRYRGRLAWQAAHTRWYLKGEYDDVDDAGNWRGHNYAQTEGPGGAAPSMSQ